MSFFQDVQAALDTRLAALAGGTPIAWENVEYTPTKDTAFLRPTLLMSASSLMDLGTLQMNQGIYQIDLFYPRNTGLGPLTSKADAIYDHFKGSTKLTSNSVDVHIKEISQTTKEIDETWYRLTVEINFKCYNN